ncbi:glycoside hydrolase family 9 protein [Saccharothrix xinjiangensis]|uniref:Endoglucanase n=1 Tax=Saccharothrix xinjiangensis TaxID=204798 RepID=A0ABV9Y1L1_9PSEU
MSGALATGTARAAEYNRILNGTFGSGTTDPWWANDKVSAAAVNGEMCATVAAGASDLWSALLGQNGVPFEAGQSYTMSFDAYAAAPRPMAVVIGQGVPPYQEMLKREFQLGTTKQRHSFTFTATMDFPDAGSGQMNFHLGGQSAESRICFDNVSLTGGLKAPGEGYTPPPKKVQVNQVAYVPGLSKQATLVSAATTPQTWVLKNSSGTTVATGQSTPKGLDAASGDSTHLIDFSSFDTPGTGYTLSVGAATSFPFDIATDEIKKLRYDSLAYFYHNRSGIPIEAQYVGAQYSRPAGHVDVAPNKGDSAVPCRAYLNCGYTLDVRGGWYDAGDHGKYVVNGGISAWQVLNTYERAKLIGDAAPLGDGKLNIPEKANGVPDILDEARWEVEFLLKMQAPDGLVHHKMHSEHWTGLPTRPDQDPHQRYLSATSTAATLNMAAVAAQTARIWKTIDLAFSAKALAAATKAYAAAKANPAKFDNGFDSGGGGYGDDRLTDEFYWAAAEMFTTTGEASYRADLTSSPHFKGTSLNARGFDWQSTGPLGDITLALVPNGLPAADIAATRSAFTVIADQHLAQVANEGYPTPYRTGDGGYDWGSNGLVANNISVLALAHDFTGQAKYRDGVYNALGYLLGRNPMSTSYVAGYGDQAFKNGHHRFWANQLDPALPITPPGTLSGGPKSGDRDSHAQRLIPADCKPQKCWVDHIQAYTVNEVTINWNSALAWVANWAAEKAGGTTTPVEDTTPPSAPGAPAASDITATGMKLTWNAATDAESGVKNYDVVALDGGAQRVVTTVSGTSATLTGLKADTPYTFAVVARNGANLTSAASQTTAVRTRPDTTPTSGCKVTYTANSWSSGLTASVTITNTGATAWNSWTLKFAFPGDQKLTHGWSADWTQTGTDITARNASWNGNIGPGGSTSVGFNASHSGHNPDPTAFAVNGQSCTKG